jgi:hypothetical protein
MSKFLFTEPEYIEEFGCFIKSEDKVLLVAPAEDTLNPDYTEYNEEDWTEIIDPAEGFRELLEEVYGVKTKFIKGSLVLT